MSGFIFKKVHVTDPDNMKANYMPYHIISYHIISYGIIDQFFNCRNVTLALKYYNKQCVSFQYVSFQYVSFQISNWGLPS